MGAIASPITSLMIVYSTVCSDADQRKHQSSASLAFVWGIHRRPVNSPHKWPVTRKMFPFDDVIMIFWYPTLFLSLTLLHIWDFSGVNSSPSKIANLSIFPAQWPAIIGHETMVCAVCLFIFLWPRLMRHSQQQRGPGQGETAKSKYRKGDPFEVKSTQLRKYNPVCQNLIWRPVRRICGAFFVQSQRVNNSERRKLYSISVCSVSHQLFNNLLCNTTISYISKLI